MKFEAFSSTAHRYARREWSDEKNRATYGDFFSHEGLGHNFRLVLEVEESVGAGQPALELIQKIDHKFLDENEPYFKTRVSSLENMTEFLFIEAKKLWPGRVVSVQLFEGSALSAFRTSTTLYLKKVYRTRSADTVYDVTVTLQGPIEADSGLLTPRPELEVLGQEHLHALIEATLKGLQPDSSAFFSAPHCKLFSVEVHNALDNSLIKSLRLLD